MHAADKQRDLENGECPIYNESGMLQVRLGFLGMYFVRNLFGNAVVMIRRPTEIEGGILKRKLSSQSKNEGPKRTQSKTKESTGLKSTERKTSIFEGF